MRLSRSGYLISEGFRSIKTHSFMSFASVTIIMACLIIMGSFALVAVNIDALIDDLEDENELVAFVDDENPNYADEESARTLQTALEAVPNVVSAEFVSRADAMENYYKSYNGTVSREGIDETVFRHRYIVHIEDIALTAQTEEQLKNVDGIAKVNAHLEYANLFIRIRNIITVIALILMVLLVFISLFIMTNTIKLATFGRREEIAIMKMVGATNGFIRLPFVIEGLILGLLGGGLGFLAEWGLYTLITRQLIGSLTGSFLTVVPFSAVAMPMLAVFLGIGVFVGAFGGVNAIRNYLKV